MKVVCKHNDPTHVPDGVPDDFDFGLKLEKKYLVMAIVIYHDSSIPYFLVDEEGRPSWFPNNLFELCDNSLPTNWFMRINRDQIKSDIFSIFGFDELCNDENFYDRLTNRDENALRTYFFRKANYG